jgi:hypothetical protein
MKLTLQPDAKEKHVRPEKQEVPAALIVLKLEKPNLPRRRDLLVLAMKLTQPPEELEDRVLLEKQEVPAVIV